MGNMEYSISLEHAMQMLAEKDAVHDGNGNVGSARRCSHEIRFVCSATCKSNYLATHHIVLKSITG